MVKNIDKVIEKVTNCRYGADTISAFMFLLSVVFMIMNGLVGIAFSGLFLIICGVFTTFDLRLRDEIKKLKLLSKLSIECERNDEAISEFDELVSVINWPLIEICCKADDE
jgi:hypothetical protein